ncbi:MAG: hypothetical protein LC747_07870 [Acidobacteria bacterium]|nr:hypothetical protein [Acidobacteriota bacterium]
MSANEHDRARTLAERIASRLAKDGQPENSAPTVVRRDSAANVGDELAALRAGLSEIGQRLTQIESHVATNDAPRSTGRADAGMSGQQPSQIRSPQNDRSPSSHTSSNPQHWLSSTYVPAVHPSEERFGIDEAVSELVEFFEREKVCNVEPGGKPCDHCGMCSSRGF